MNTCARCGIACQEEVCDTCAMLFHSLIHLCIVASQERGIPFPQGDVIVSGTARGPVTVKAGHLTFTCIYERDDIWHLWVKEGLKPSCPN